MGVGAFSTSLSQLRVRFKQAGSLLFYTLQRKADAPKSDAKSITDKISSVKMTFSQYNTDKLKRVHACLFTVYRQILENKDSNQYDMPHEGSRKRQRIGNDVCDMTVTPELRW